MLILDGGPELCLGLEVGEIVENTGTTMTISWLDLQDDVFSIIMKEFKDGIRVYLYDEILETIQPKDMELKYSSIAESWTLVFKE